MEKLEYIPGDLVMTNGVSGGTAKDVVYRVVLSDPSRIFVLDDGTVLKGIVRLENLEDAKLEDEGYLYYGSSYVYSKDIIPIPLTPEILEKNGWKSINGKYALKIKNANYVVLEFTEYGIYTYINENTMLFTIKYIHELQHLLYALHIDSNLKI
jgi:hypothetical protein